MSVRFFGQFLLERGVIRPDQLLKAVEFQRTRNKRFGEYAVDKGYLTTDDVERVNAAQQQQDKRFGELAVELGLLSEAQVQELLTLQQNDHVFIGEALVHCEFLSEAELGQQLAEFTRDQAHYADTLYDVPEGVEDVALVRVAVDLTIKLLERVAQIQTKADELRLDGAPAARFAWVALDLSGAATATFGLNVDEALARRLAVAMLEDELDGEPDEVIVDAVKEFVNIVCGNVAAKLAQRGRAVELGPPHAGVPNGGALVVAPLVATEGICELVLAIAD